MLKALQLVELRSAQQKANFLRKLPQSVLPGYYTLSCYILVWQHQQGQNSSYVSIKIAFNFVSTTPVKLPSHWIAVTLHNNVSCLHSVISKGIKSSERVGLSQYLDNYTNHFEILVIFGMNSTLSLT